MQDTDSVIARNLFTLLNIYLSMIGDTCKSAFTNPLLNLEFVVQNANCESSFLAQSHCK